MASLLPQGSSIRSALCHTERLVMYAMFFYCNKCNFVQNTQTD